jgi:hypothetical protein
MFVQEEVEHEEGATGGVVLPRTAFLHTADQLHCPLFLPWPGDQVGTPHLVETMAMAASNMFCWPSRLSRCIKRRLRRVC